MAIKRQLYPGSTFGVLLSSLFVICFFMQVLSMPLAFAQTSIENDFLALLNEERVKLGKNPVAANSYLATAAYLHSQDMAENGYFSHTSLDGRTFDQRIVAAGYTNYSSLAENVAYAYGAANAERVFGMWKNSTGHYVNMMGDFTDAGLGFYSKNGYTYYTLDLGKSSAQIPEFPSAVVLFAFFLFLSAFTLVTHQEPFL